MAVLPRLVVAGTQSGAGKTTIATGLMAALSRRGLAVQGYKAGPDYIDPTYHTLATGRPSRNLDAWMFGEPQVQELFGRSMAGAGLGIVEGVMGLFDGYSPVDDTGSTAQVARWLQAPVLLVVDAGGMARSVAAMVQGYAGFDPDLRVAGVVFNNLGGEGHYKLLVESLARYCPGVQPLGYLPKKAAIRAPERHLGLVPSYEQGTVQTYLDSLVAAISATVDLDAVVALARTAPDLALPAPALFPATTAAVQARIGIARDEAFQFYYQDGLDLLAALGAELVPFSPLRDQALPEVDLLYFGGGFPEVYRERLAANTGMLAAIRQGADAGMPIYAECGGLMYLCTGIADQDGDLSPMVGLLPVTARMQPKLAMLGYVSAQAERDCLLAPAGASLRGHEFHWSVVDAHPPDWPPIYAVQGRRGGVRAEGFARPNLLASYVHLHLVANQAAARALVAAARTYRQSRKVGGAL